MFDKTNPLTVIELFAGYGSQRMALERIKRDFPPFDYKVLAISEIEPSALKAYQAVHGDCPNLGDVSKIEWGEHPELKDVGLVSYSFPCFVKETLIHTERGYIPIEQVTTSDKVLTHTNKYQRVLAVGSRDNAPLMRVRGMCFKDIICTPNHPFYVRKRYKEWHNPTRRWISTTACYKLAGNSIVVSCLYHLFRTMFVPDQLENKKQMQAKQMTIFDYL